MQKEVTEEIEAALHSKTSCIFQHKPVVVNSGCLLESPQELLSILMLRPHSKVIK